MKETKECIQNNPHSDITPDWDSEKKSYFHEVIKLLFQNETLVLIVIAKSLDRWSLTNVGSLARQAFLRKLLLR